MKAWQNGDLYAPASAGGTTPEVSLGLVRCLGGPTFIVPMSLNIPVRVGISRPVFLGTSDFNLPEAPLRQIDIASPQITTQDCMLQSECCSKCPNLGSIT